MPPKPKKKSPSTMPTINEIPEKYKSYIEEKKKEIQKKFTDFVDSNNNITFIYGGKTTQTVKERHSQHIKEESPKFDNTEHKLLLNCKKLKGESNKNDANSVLSILESYLIDLIEQKYPNINENDIKGGGGRKSEQKNYYYLYIIYR
jgi:hypothetical protein